MRGRRRAQGGGGRSGGEACRRYRCNTAGGTEEQVWSHGRVQPEEECCSERRRQRWSLCGEEEVAIGRKTWIALCHVACSEERRVSERLIHSITIFSVMLLVKQRPTTS